MNENERIKESLEIFAQYKNSPMIKKFIVSIRCYYNHLLITIEIKRS